MLGHCLRRWVNMETWLLVFAEAGIHVKTLLFKIFVFTDVESGTSIQQSE